MELQKRLPRPQGSTFLSMRFQQSNTQEDREAIFKHVISAYTLQGFMWNNVPCTINQLSQILRLPTQIILLYISELGQNMGSLASAENIENTLKSIITLSTTWAIQDRGLVSNQLNQLLASQDGKYKPFITAEVNKVLKLMIDSNKGMQDAYKTFFTSANNVTNILNVTQKDKAVSEQEYLSPDQALLMIQEAEKKALSDGKPNTIPATKPASLTKTVYSDDADKLFEGYGLANFGSVKENRTGTSALEPSEMANTPQSQGDAGQDKEEDGGFKRRKIEVVDLDELPTE